MKIALAIVVILWLGLVAGYGDDHGDTALSASLIEPDGSLLTACIEEPGDMDYFLFSASAGRTYRLETSHPTGGMDAILYLIGRDGQAILSVDDNSAGDTSSRVVWACPQSGIYFLMVRHAQATTGTGCYGLSASLVQLDDHGNDRLSASPLAEGVTVSGYLEESSDVDVFLFPVDPGYEYTMAFSAAGNDLSAALFRNGASSPLLTLTSSGVTRTDTLAATDSEPLFIVIQSVSGAESGSYTLSITRGGYADDHASTLMGATPIPVQWSETRGNLEVPGDTDWFQVDARQGAEYSFVVSSEGAPGLHLAVRGPDGQLLQESGSAGLAGAIEITWQAPEAGSYFLEISSSTSAGTGTYVLSVATTLQLEAVGAFNPSGYSLDVAVQDDTAYLVVGTKGLLIIDIGNPSDPFEVGSHSTNGYAQAVAIRGKTAFVANRSEGVTVIDVSDPSRPIQTGTLDTPGSAQSITILDNLALIADQRGGVLIARIGSGQDLTALAAIETSGYPTAIAVANNLALVSMGDAGLDIIDLRTPEAPAIIGQLDLPGDASGIAVYDHLAYVAVGYRGVRIVDFSDPTAPTEIGSLATAGEAASAVVSGSTLFVAEQSAGLSVYSLLEPTDPQLIARIDTPGEATRAAVLDGVVYIADRQEGMLIVQLLP